MHELLKQDKEYEYFFENFDKKTAKLKIFARLQAIELQEFSFFA